MPYRSKKFHRLKKILHQHRRQALMRLHARHRHLKKIIKRHRIKLANIRQKGARAAASGAIAGSLSLIPVSGTHKLDSAAAEPNGLDQSKINQADKFLVRYGPKKLDSVNASRNILLDIGSQENFQAKIKQIAQEIDKTTAPQYEEEIGQIIQANYGIRSSVSLDDKRLNTYFGPLGAEQHLPRYPGDSAAGHSDNPVIRSSGITPGRGAWGWWTNSKVSLTAEQIEQEKYYIAAQTFLAPGFRENPQEIYNWMKYRKIIMINPSNGKAVVAVIGDAGPATWTGKNFGGSPEVMQALEAHDGRGRASVFVLFVDDPENKIPLGPIESSNIKLAAK